MADPDDYKNIPGMSPAEDLNGPFYYQRCEGGLRFGFKASIENCNGIGTVHGGVLMMFADYVATMTALAGVKEHCATINFSSDFVSAAQKGEWIEGTCEVVKRTAHMTFVQGELAVGDRLVMTFRAILRRIVPKD